MVLVPLGEKDIDILVNGNQEGSFKQRTEAADYNIDISTSAEVDDVLAHSSGNTYSDDDNELSFISGRPFTAEGLNLDMHITGGVSCQNNCSSRVEITHSGGTEDFEADGIPQNGSQSENIDVELSNVTEIYYEQQADDLNSTSYNVEATVQQTTTSSYSVNNVTQS